MSEPRGPYEIPRIPTTPGHKKTFLEKFSHWYDTSVWRIFLIDLPACSLLFVLMPLVHTFQRGRECLRYIWVDTKCVWKDLCYEVPREWLDLWRRSRKEKRNDKTDHHQ